MTYRNLRIIFVVVFLLLVPVISGSLITSTIFADTTLVGGTTENTTQLNTQHSVADNQQESPKRKHKKKTEIQATGEHSQKLIEKKSTKSVSSWARYKMKLPFWQRKAVTFCELALIIMIGIILGQILEELGIIKFISFITWPISRIGKLPKSTGPAFIFSLQSGAIANSMLIAQCDNKQLTKRELYTSVFVVSSLSLFAHLPSLIPPFIAAFGLKASLFYFGVRFGAIILQVIVILLVSSLFFSKRKSLPSPASQPETQNDTSVKKPEVRTKFITRVWRKSKKSITRLMIYLLPTFIVVSLLERSGFFEWFGNLIITIPIINLLPAQAAAIIPAQAINLYNGAIMAASFVDTGVITIRQAMLILLMGTLITAPIRTLKHSVGSYIAILGARPGIIMAIATQLTRSIFLLLFIIACALVWR
jgi:hypothetical protein